MIVLVARARVFLAEEHVRGGWFAHLQPGPPCSPLVYTHTRNIAPILVGQQAVPRGVDRRPSQVRLRVRKNHLGRDDNRRHRPYTCGCCFFS